MAQLKAKRAKKTLPAASDSSDAEASLASGDEGNTGWANSMLKVLETTKAAPQKAVLSRAKKLTATKAQQGKRAKKDFDFELDGAEVKQEEKKPDVKPDESALNAELTKQQRKNVPLQLRMKPNFRDIERERNLRKVATRGTVQFFNAVRIQQKDIQQQLVEAGPLDSRQDAVLNNIDKRKFLDVLMSGKRAKSSLIDNAVKKEEQETDSDDDDATDDEEQSGSAKKKKEWNVLREDFMTNKKIKHWDEEDEEEQEEDNQSDDSDDE
ncbi:hypothetical protein KR044_002476 [Drosophila immigrans]|nr:hypothetical protein KR044_002476 [Drosophila immigrans]